MAKHHQAAHLHKKTKREPFDMLLYFFTIATPLFELPQAIAIYSAKSAANVSVFTWVFFIFADIVWFVYAARRRLVPLMVMYTLYFAVEMSVVVGIFLYSN